MIKKEFMQINRKRIQCNMHGNIVKYKCQFPNCTSPYLCHDSQCIDQHFHEDSKVIMARFNGKMWSSKLEQVQSAINNDSIKLKEEYLQKVVSYFTKSLHKMHHEINQFQEVKSKIYFESSPNLNNQYLQKINEFLSLGSKLQRKLDVLRNKINDEIQFDEKNSSSSQEVVQIIPPPFSVQQNISDIFNHQSIKKRVQMEKQYGNSSIISENNQENCEEEQKNISYILQQKEGQFSINMHLTAFLQQNLKGFSWDTSKVIFSSESHFTTCQKFHNKLRGKDNLLFLFIGSHQIIGAFYKEPYPSVKQKYRKDPSSFIFVQESEQPQKFSMFVADSQSQSHITISQKLLICQGNTPNNGDGLRTFQRNFDTLAYFLPSKSFHCKNDGQQSFNGVLKIKQFYVIQINDS